ncbi:MAG TPA: DUF1700 domain-containing protein [Acholeplasmataceae bacterium]|nr:DUF1700 domain-containing protein [Acholeplasmataceae bacterium]
MNKNEYLKELKEIFKINHVDPKETEQIIADYEELFNEGLDQGLTDEEVVIKLGEPKEVFKSLKQDLSFKIKHQSKTTGLMVFITLILFFTLGYGFNLWDYNWLSFFLIPITAIVTNVKDKNKYPALSVFLSFIIFFIFGARFGLWHPLWLIFFTIPITAIVVHVEKKQAIIALMPFLSIIIYILVSYFYPVFYKTGWTLFFLTPIVASFTKPFTNTKVWLGIILILSVMIYIGLSIKFGNWRWPLFVFLLPFFYGLLTKMVNVKFPIKYLLKHPILFALFIAIIASYLIVSIVYQGWSWTWTILLLIPMLFIYLEEKFKNIVSYMPFVSVILFFLFGKFIEDGFNWSWMFFFLIPMTAIITDGPKKKVKEPSDSASE